MNIKKIIQIAILFLCAVFPNTSKAYASESSSTIPVINMEDFHNLQKREGFINALREAFHYYGFVAITHAGVDTEALDTGYDAAIRFFRQSLEIKNEIKSLANSGERGYVTSESPQGRDLSFKDFKEFLHIGNELSPEQKLSFGYPDNIWPKNDHLKEPMMHLFEALKETMLTIGEGISLAMGEGPSFITNLIQDGDTLMRALHYPANPPAGIWAAEHSDISFFTILPRASSEGLQVEVRDGSWVDVTVPDNSVIVNVGAMLQNMTNGYFRSSIHRVLSKDPLKERFSIVLFAHAHNEDDMSPRPQTIQWTGGVPRYPKASRQELLWDRIVETGRATPEMVKWVGHSGLMDRMIEHGKASVKTMRILKEQGVASPKVLEELTQL